MAPETISPTVDGSLSDRVAVFTAQLRCVQAACAVGASEKDLGAFVTADLALGDLIARFENELLPIIEQLERIAANAGARAA